MQCHISSTGREYRIIPAIMDDPKFPSVIYTSTSMCISPSLLNTRSPPKVQCSLMQNSSLKIHRLQWRSSYARFREARCRERMCRCCILSPGHLVGVGDIVPACVDGDVIFRDTWRPVPQMNSVLILSIGGWRETCCSILFLAGTSLLGEFLISNDITTLSG